MNSWYVKNLGDALWADEGLQAAKTLFEAAYDQAGHPADMALLMRHESDGRLHCELKLYFSPAAADVANQLDALPCARPNVLDLGLVSGSDTAMKTLF